MGRNKKFVKEESTIESAFDLGRSTMEELKDEMDEWRENMEGAGTGLENTGKFETIQETASTLEDAHCEIETVEIPAKLNGWPVEYSYLKPYGRKPMSRYDRSGMAQSALEGVLDVLESIVTAFEEKSKDGHAESDVEVLQADQLRDLDDEALEELVTQIKDIQSEIENSKDGLEQAEFPGMFG